MAPSQSPKRDAESASGRLRICVRLLATVLGLMCWTACVAPETDPSTEQAVPAPLPVDVATEAPLPLETLLFNARQWIADGDYARALDLLAGPVAADAAADQVRERALLRTEARRHLLQSRVVDVWVQVKDVPITLGEQAPVELCMANISSQQLRIGGVGASGASAFRVEAMCEEFPADGTQVQHKLTTTLSLGPELVLEPGCRQAFPFTIDSSEVSPESPTARIYTIAATLHTGSLQSEGSQQLAALIFRPARLLVLPRNWEPLQVKPLEQLESALVRGAALHLPVVAALLPANERAQGLARLQRAQADPATPPQLHTALRVAVQLCKRLAERVVFPPSGVSDRQPL